MMLGVWMAIVALAFLCSVPAVAGYSQRPASLGMMFFWLLAAYGATSIEKVESGVTTTQTEAAVAAVAFVCFGAGIVFLADSFVSRESDEDDAELPGSMNDLDIGGMD